MKYEKSESKSKKNPELKNNNAINSSNNRNKGEETIKQNESKKSAVKYKYDPNNPYPKYILGEDENLYLNIYNYLKNGLIKNKRTWPNYIEEIADKKKKEQKKVDFCRKIGVYKRKGKQNKANNSEKSKEQYIVENEELFLIKKLKKENLKEGKNKNIKIEFIEKNIKSLRLMKFKIYF